MRTRPAALSLSLSRRTRTSISIRSFQRFFQFQFLFVSINIYHISIGKQNQYVENGNRTESKKKRSGNGMWWSFGVCATQLHGSRVCACERCVATLTRNTERRRHIRRMCAQTQTNYDTLRLSDGNCGLSMRAIIAIIIMISRFRIRQAATIPTFIVGQGTRTYVLNAEKSTAEMNHVNIIICLFLVALRSILQTLRMEYIGHCSGFGTKYTN